MRSLIPFTWSRQSPSREGFVDPFHVLQREVDRIFEDFAGGRVFRTALDDRGAHMPRVDISETDKAVDIEVELPGIDEKDVTVTVRDDVLTVTGERRHERDEKKKDYRLVERSFGAFSRSIALPFAVDPDAVKADFSKGVLTITLPKPAEEQRKSKRIEVQSKD